MTPEIAGTIIILKETIFVFSCCSGVGNHSNEPVNKYNNPDKKTIQIIIHRTVRKIFISFTTPRESVYLRHRRNIVCAKHNTVCRRQHRFVFASRQ